MHVRTVFAAVLACLVSVPAFASGWVVERAATFSAYAVDGKTWVEITPGLEIPNSAWIQTGRRGRVLLTRDAERIVVKPNSLAAISTWQENGRKTKVTHRMGSVLLDVETQNEKHTSVVTPHLAAVVKGTVFEVTTTRRGSTVRVDEGVVEVGGSDGSGRKVAVAAGMAAKVKRGQRGGVTLAKAVGTPDFEVAEQAASSRSGAGKRNRTSRVQGATNLPGSGGGGAGSFFSNANNNDDGDDSGVERVSSTGNGNGNNGNGNGNGGGNGSNGGGNGNGNNGNGNGNGGGNGNGNNGNGNGNGGGNGSNGGGNGNGNNGNGNGNGGGNGSNGGGNGNGNNGNGNGNGGGNGSNGGGNGNGNNGNGNGNGGCNGNSNGNGNSSNC